MDAALFDQINQLCYQLVRWLPSESMRDPSLSFMHRAMVGMLLIAPMAAMIGVQVVNFRLAFFSEAVGHSAFTGIGLGLWVTALATAAGWQAAELTRLGLSATDAELLLPQVIMVFFGVLVGLAITAWRRLTVLSSDTVIGVFSSTVIALGLCVITYLRHHDKLPRFDLEAFLMGNILLVREVELLMLAAVFLAVLVFQLFAYNRLMFIGLNPVMASTLRIPVAAYEYALAVLLSLVVMFSIRAVGVLLVTALIVIPAASARHVARSAGGLFWWAVLIATTSAVGGLLVSDYLGTVVGGTTVLISVAWFLLTTAYVGAFRRL